MTKVYLFILTIAFSLVAKSADWQVVAESDRSMSSIDIENISKIQNSIYKTWVLTNLKKDMSIKNVKVRSLMTLLKVNCAERSYLKTQSLASAFYSEDYGNGVIVESSGVEEERFVNPGTIGESTAILICVYGLSMNSKK